MPEMQVLILWRNRRRRRRIDLVEIILCDSKGGEILKLRIACCGRDVVDTASDGHSSKTVVGITRYRCSCTRVKEEAEENQPSKSIKCKQVPSWLHTHTHTHTHICVCVCVCTCVCGANYLSLGTMCFSRSLINVNQLYSTPIGSDRSYMLAAHTKTNYKSF